MGRCGPRSARTGSPPPCSARGARCRLPCPSPSPGSSSGRALLGVETDEPASWILPLGLAYFAAGLYVPRSRMPGGPGERPRRDRADGRVNAAQTGRRPGTSCSIAFVAGRGRLASRSVRRVDAERALAAEAARARFERELEAERGAAAERRRIARELHDVLANSLSVMIVQASLAADLVVADPAGRGGRPSPRWSARAGPPCGETGRLLRLIEDGAGALGTHPQPGVADLPALADEYARAGLGDRPRASTTSRRRLPDRRRALELPDRAGGADQRAQARAGQPRPHPARACEGSEVAIEVRNGRGRAQRRSPSSPAVTAWSACASACRCSAARSTPARRPTAGSSSPRRCPSTRSQRDERRPRRRPGPRPRRPAGAAARPAGVDVLAEAEHGRAAVEATPLAPTRRARDGHPDAGHGRHRRDPRSGRAAARDARADPHDLRPRRVRLPGAARRRRRLHAQGDPAPTGSSTPSRSSPPARRCWHPA